MSSLLLISSVAQAGLKAPKPDESDAFFASPKIAHFRIEIANTNIASLRREPRKNVPAKVTVGTNVYQNVAIHLKGAAGSFRNIDDSKPALTLNFDKFKDGQEFHNIDKLHLNNSVQDPSYMTEILCSELFQQAGVPATRATHARVTLNGRFQGLYVLKEGFDKQFLRRYFNNFKGNLYDGGFIRDVTDPLERDSGEGDVAHHGDLKTLAEAAMESDPQRRWQRLEELLAMDCMLSFMALEVMTWHWDGYTIHRNNYRVYHEPVANKIYFFPHGMDQMFWVPEGALIPPNLEGLVARAIVNTPEGRKRYKQRIGALLTNIFTAERLTTRLNELQKRVRPVLAAIDEQEARDHDGAVANLRRQIVGRVDGVQRLLTMPEPKPLKFDSSGAARLTQWREHNTAGNGRFARVSAHGAETLHIRARSPGQCSWRSSVLLDPGNYRFEAKIKTAGVGSFRNERGDGAGLRKSGSRRSRGLLGDSDWKLTTYDFSVQDVAQDVVLVCELTALKGEAWFDLNSLKLIRK
ncbi:MAG: CotH kinase family protein [Verrucomicrobia subdivision 3 bacterium]|nr:CotH kinase family protein [Limisphaerales bacterium]